MNIEKVIFHLYRRLQLATLQLAILAILLVAFPFGMVALADDGKEEENIAIENPDYGMTPLQIRNAVRYHINAASPPGWRVKEVVVYDRHIEVELTANAHAIAKVRSIPEEFRPYEYGDLCPSVKRFGQRPVEFKMFSFKTVVLDLDCAVIRALARAKGK